MQYTTSRFDPGEEKLHSMFLKLVRGSNGSKNHHVRLLFTYVLKFSSFKCSPHILSLWIENHLNLPLNITPISVILHQLQFTRGISDDMVFTTCELLQMFLLYPLVYNWHCVKALQPILCFCFLYLWAVICCLSVYRWKREIMHILNVWITIPS